jgi:alkanesulfonate monooxygenase SsuD/methylene tetrahydromethanopterin reductase-like flavin-dependent oxidoreductase (luciferase family)
MRTGIYFDLRNPPRWRRPWPAFYAQTLERIGDAERLGVDDVWLSEHHFFEDGYLPQPLTFAAAVAARTERVRIGTAILLSLGRELLAPYREGLLEGGFEPQSARMTGLVNALVSDDPDTAWERVREHFAYQTDTYRAYGAEGTGFPEPDPIDPEAWRGPGGSRGGLPRLQVLTPADTVRFVKASVDGLPAVGGHFWASIAGMPDDLVRRHVELVCTEVRPGLAGV